MLKDTVKTAFHKPSEQIVDMKLYHLKICEFHTI